MPGEGIGVRYRRAGCSPVPHLIRDVADNGRMTKPAPQPDAEQFQTVRQPEIGSCHCRCGTHPEFPGTCRGYAEPGLTVVVDSPTAGPQHVPLCRNCHDIRMGLAPQRDSGLEAVTDTCTCHCMANHPGRPGICEAASDAGTAIDGSPACIECASAGRS